MNHTCGWNGPDVVLQLHNEWPCPYPYEWNMRTVTPNDVDRLQTSVKCYDASACNSLAVCHQLGLGKVAIDCEKARHLYRQALELAEQTNGACAKAAILNNLAVLHRMDWLRPEHNAQQRASIRRRVYSLLYEAAEHGLLMAMLNLCVCYRAEKLELSDSARKYYDRMLSSSFEPAMFYDGLHAMDKQRREDVLTMTTNFNSPIAWHEFGTRLPLAQVCDWFSQV